MKILAAVFVAVFAVISVEAAPQSTRGHFQHRSAYRPQLGGTHFIARSGNGFHPRFYYNNAGIVVFEPFDNGGDNDLAGDDTVYQGQVAPQDAESLPYATPTSDPDIVISPYEPHAAIDVAGVPQGVKVLDPVSNLVFLNP